MDPKRGAAEPSPEGPADLRRVFRRHAAAVAVVTASTSAGPVGLLITSLASVSAEPPLFSFNVSAASSSWSVFQQARHIGMHVLHAGQHDLAQRFTRKGSDRFAPPTSWRHGPLQVPLLEDCAAWCVASVEQRFPVADHIIVAARLLFAGVCTDRPPLLHHDGSFHRAAITSSRTENLPSSA
jgi:flavin reductase (DIM6/NTAB) family NADH-FMN oxidoreductase RutF